MSAVVPQARKNGIIRDPRFWVTSAGYEFQFKAGNADMAAALSATNDGLPGYGWTVTSIATTEGSAGDFLSSADVDPTRFVTDAASDQFRCSLIFGSYAHALQASRFLGYFPTKLTVETYAAFTVASANETTYIGFASSGPRIVSNGTNFQGVGASTSTGAAVDNAWHVWKIEVNATTCEWFIDNVSQGTFNTATDDWPVGFGLFCSVAGTNRISVAWGRVFYS